MSIAQSPFESPASAKLVPLSESVQHALDVSLKGVSELLPQAQWIRKLQQSQSSGKPLRIKLGLDPTAPDIHLGHTVVLNKMRQLQELGHTVIFLIGDFTSAIGDPSGRNSTRPPLTREQIEANAQTYYAQASKVLDPEKTEIRYNSQWCDALGARGMVQLAAKHTLARMLERDDFAKRYAQQQPISLHELLYPLIQGYDSVALNSDLELGGTDQKFNLLVGRQLQIEYGQSAQCVLIMPLLEGLDGVEKMSKSKNNYIGITDPANTMFAKVLSISDALMWRWYPLLSVRPQAEIDALQRATQDGRNPRDVKIMLAHEITARFHSEAAARAALEDFHVRARGGIPHDIAATTLQGAPLTIVQALKDAGLTSSNGQGMRLIEGGGVRVDGVVVSDKALCLPAGSYVLQIGKRRFMRVQLLPPSASA